MMNQILQFLTDQLHSQFVGGGLLLLFSGSLVALCRKVPGDLWDWFVRRATVRVEILNSDPLFDYVTLWLDCQPYSRRSRRLTATTSTRIDSQEGNAPSEVSAPRKKLQVFLSPAPGTHAFLYGGSLLWLVRNRDDHSSGPGGDKIFSLHKAETYTISMLGRNQSVIRALINSIVQEGSTPEQVRLFTSSWGYWNSSNILHARKLTSVVLPVGVAESILADAKEFLSKADWYRDVGIPWHRGYLLYGVPGSGKTSLVSALAGELGMDLYLLNLSSGMSDERLFDLMSRVQPGTIILMEDVDCTFPNRDTEASKDRVTLSGLLNCLDGVQSREGCMIFMTTNRVYSLDEALLRPGRVDVRVEFNLATEEQTARLRDRLNTSVSDEELVECQGMSMAEVQQFLLEPKRKALV